LSRRHATRSQDDEKFNTIALKEECMQRLKHFELMKGEQWEEYAVSKARALAAGLRDLLKELQGTWCGRRLAIDLRKYHTCTRSANAYSEG
jgi:uncharacterized protein YjfI (DUF2170 family)